MITKVKTQASCASLKAFVVCALLVGLQATAQAAVQVGVFQGKTFGEWSGI
jgi:hypothetical protein